jgi:hypothetical protein
MFYLKPDSCRLFLFCFQHLVTLRHFHSHEVFHEYYVFRGNLSWYFQISSPSDIIIIKYEATQMVLKYTAFFFVRKLIAS